MAVRGKNGRIGRNAKLKVEVDQEEKSKPDKPSGKVEADQEKKSKPDKPPGKRDLACYRKKLAKMLEDAIRIHQAPVAGIQGADPGDQASQESDVRGLLLSKKKAYNEIPKIRLAILLLDCGEFGICKDCGEPIPKKRLDACPSTYLCIDCQTAKEEEEKKLTGRRGAWLQGPV